MKNRRGANCDNCSTWLKPGAGDLWRCGGGDTGCMKHYDEDGGWHVSCPDRAACASRRNTLLAEKRARKDVDDREDAIRNRLRKTFSRLVTDDEEGAKYRDVLCEAPTREIVELRGFGDRLYGGGAWLVVDRDLGAIFVRNNGHDGDDWRFNFVRTGGAGAEVWLAVADTDLGDVIASGRTLAVRS